MALFNKYPASFGSGVFNATALNLVIDWVNGFRGASVTFAKAPSNPYKGQVQWFSDSNTVTFGATIAGSSTNTVLGLYDGTNWTVFAL